MQEEVITMAFKESPMPTQVKTILDWKYLACKVFQDLKYRTGYQKMWVDIGARSSKGEN